MSVRLFVDADQLVPGTLVLGGDEHHYLSRARRLAVGDSVTLLDGQGNRAQALLTQIGPKSSTLQVQEREAVPAPSFQLTMAPALITAERMDQALSKMVELGVACIQPMTTERTIVRLRPERAAARHKRFEALAMAAARQSQNAHPSIVLPPASFAEVLGALPGPGEGQLRLIPCLSEPNRPLEEVLPEGSLSSAVVLIGPEGGFSEKEIAMATEARFVPISLGTRILRAETACIAMASILAFRYGDVGRR